MTKLLVLLASLFLITPLSTTDALAAAPRQPDGGEAFTPSKDVPCLTDQQREEIKSQLAASRARLRAEGKLPQAKQSAIVLFDWPLRAAYNLTDFGYHGISNFVDQDPDTGELLDYNCGQRTYDLPSGYDHSGIDYFNFPFSWYKMDNDLVEIVAAAPGVILDKIDGNNDRSCGFGSGNWNAVYVEHADGSVAWYGHMKNGSQTSKEEGDPVVVGEFLGVVGSSGNSTGPHLHFEVYDPDGDLVEPYFGPCNGMNNVSWWAAQRPYFDSAINAVLTHDAAPVIPACPMQETPNDRDAFLPGEAITFAIYYRDQLGTQNTDYSVLRPDNSVQWSWSHTPPNPYYSAVYWFWNDVLPANAPVGTWTLRAEYNGTTYDHPFQVCSDPGNPPVVTCPDDITVECTRAGGTPWDHPAILAFIQAASATGTCDLTPLLTNDAPNFFPSGPTVVTFTATDDFGAQGSCSATITIDDTTPPDITCPGDITVECTESGGTPATHPAIAALLAGATATDICDANPVIGNDAPNFFPVGETVVTFSATDVSGEVGTCTATVTVEDTTPPTISVELNRYILWPPNHKMMPITALVEVEDICDPNPAIVLESITSDEPDEGLGDGDFPNDIQQAAIGTFDVTFLLRAERSGNGDGRVYTIVYSVTDESNNSTPATVYVEVPHNRHGRVLAGDGFAADGRSLDPGASEYSFIIPGSVDLNVEGIEAEHVHVGNDMGAVLPRSHRLVEGNGDGQVDLEVVFDVASTIELLRLSSYPAWMIFQHRDAGSFEVVDIFALGAPVAVEPVTPADDAILSAQLRPTPNPFSASTRISYAVTGSAPVPVRIGIYDVAGRKIRTLVNELQAPGNYAVTWDRHADDGTRVAAGVYLQRSMIGRRADIAHLVVLK